MILLLGGTSETAPLAEGLTAAGYEVLVSLATETPLDLPGHPRLHRRSGPLDGEALAALIRDRRIRAIVDATHPYAALIRAAAAETAARLNIPYLTFVRPAVVPGSPGIAFAADHDEGAREAFSHGLPVLLAIGSRNIAPYVRESRRTALKVVARCLPGEASLGACRQAGLEDESVVAARGPFTVEENRALIRQHRIGVLVTKDSGAAGGVREKLEAARLEGCRVVVVERPPVGVPDAFGDIQALLEAVEDRIGKAGSHPSGS